MGRYGPDEFLLVVHRTSSPTSAGRRPRSDQPGGPQPSVRRDRAAAHHGQRRYRHLPRPRHIRDHAARGRGAGTRGGEGQRRDTVRDAADRSEDDAAAGTSFDVLQGLVIAVDTRTGIPSATPRTSPGMRRSSRRIDMPADEIRTLSVAGLLHDIEDRYPDGDPRKPGQLTEAEYAIVKQHVALGDMIVRDSPDVAVVRAGIRHHHERWTGRAGLDRLEGEAIPLIARILAVADAFSAMTTTRPIARHSTFERPSCDSVTPPGRSSRSASSSLSSMASSTTPIRRCPGRPAPSMAFVDRGAGRMRTFGRLVARAHVHGHGDRVDAAGHEGRAAGDGQRRYLQRRRRPAAVSERSGRRPRQRLRSGPHGSEANRSRARDRDRQKRNGSFTYQPAAAMSVTIRSRPTLAF